MIAFLAFAAVGLALYAVLKREDIRSWIESEREEDRRADRKGGQK